MAAATVASLCRRLSLLASSSTTVPGQHVDQQQAVVLSIPERPLTVKGAGVSELLRECAHIQPPSTIHRWAVQARESSAASQSSSRATSSGYTLSGRHW